MDIPKELEFLRPLTSGWCAKIELARNARSSWQEIASECKMFFSKSAAAMWDPKYTRKFWKGIPAPRFRVTINKAFELVAVFGPNLIWDIPHRQVEPKKMLEIPIDLFGDPNDQQVVANYQQLMSTASQETAVDKIVAHLMQGWLNYTPREMPGGGLEEHSILAVTDALVKGRGVLWSKPYQFPSSGRMLTGCFREPPENLFIDPDFNTIDDAKWIGIRRVQPVWEVERRFNLKKDSLKNKSTLESAWAEGEYRTDDEYSARRREGTTNDLMEYYEIWSKTGPGSRLTGMSTQIKEHLEETVGDYAWIVVAPNIPYPLNCPSDKLRGGMSSDEVRDRFRWPVETWRDDRWPIEVLDFYPDPDSAWPVAPLAPALGELKFLNIMIPHVMNRIWSSSRDFWAVTQQAYDAFVSHLQNGGDQTVFPIPPSVLKISDAVSVMQQPQTNLDVWKIIEAVSALFDKRTGLTDFVYGMNEGGSQDRSAETTMARRQATGVRPQYMGRVVAKWQSRAAALEAFCARIFVEGKDVVPLFGQVGATLWDQFVKSTDVERVARQMGYTVAASSIRRPDKDREISNMNQMMTVFLPIAAGAAANDGNYVAVNEMIKRWGDAAEMNMEGLEIPMPQPNPQQEAAQQLEAQKLQLEAQKLQADIMGKQIDAQSKQADAQAKQAEAQSKQMLAQIQMQQKMQETQVKGQEAAQKLKLQESLGQLKQQEQVTAIQLKAMQAQLDAQAKEAAAQQKLMQDAMSHQQELGQDQEQFEQDLTQDRTMHTVDMLQSMQTHQQSVEQTEDMGKVKVDAAKKMSKASGNAKKKPGSK